MLSKKLFIAAGTAVLGVVGFFAANANSKKFVTSVTTAWFQTAGNTFVTLFHAAAVANHLTTASSASKTATAYFATVSAGVETRHQMYITNSAIASKKLYRK